jgi:hypothetical protein
MDITETSKEAFVAYATDACNWKGDVEITGGYECWIGHYRPYDLTELERAGLIRTQFADGETWLIFTGMGREYARQLGVAYSEVPLTDAEAVIDVGHGYASPRSLLTCRRYTPDQGCPLHGEYCNEYEED